MHINHFPSCSPSSPLPCEFDSGEIDLTTIPSSIPDIQPLDFNAYNDAPFASPTPHSDNLTDLSTSFLNEKRITSIPLPSFPYSVKDTAAPSISTRSQQIAELLQLIKNKITNLETNERIQLFYAQQAGITSLQPLGDPLNRLSHRCELLSKLQVEKANGNLAILAESNPNLIQEMETSLIDEIMKASSELDSKNAHNNNQIGFIYNTIINRQSRSSNA